MSRFLSALLLLLPATGAVAQIASPASTTAPGAPSISPSSTAPAPTTMLPYMEFPQSNVKDVMTVYEQITGKRIIYDVQAIGELSIVVNSPISFEEAKKLIETSLIMNGFMLVPVDEKYVKLLGIARNPRSFGIPLISDELQIPESEQVVSFLFKLRFADPAEVGTLVSNYVGQGEYRQALAMPKSQALLITENSLIIRKIAQIIRELDVPPAEVVSEFFKLERADAKDVLEKLEKIFEKQQTPATGTPGVPGAPVAPRRNRITTPEGNVIPAEATAVTTGPNSVEIDGGTLSEDSIIIGKIKLTADTRTRRLHVVTRPVNLTFIRSLIREFDANIPFPEPALRPLRNVAAGDILDAIVDAIKEPGQENSGGGSSSSSASRNSSSRNSNSNRSSSSNSNDIFGSNSNSNSGFGGGFGGGGGGSSTLSESLSTSERDSIPETRIVGNTTIIADKRANTIIVVGTRDSQEKIFALLDKLDVRAPQVTIHTVIGELNLSNNQRFGVQYILNSGSRRSLIGTVTGDNGNGTGTGDGTGTGSVANNSGAISINNGSAGLNLANLLSDGNIQRLAVGGASGLSGFIAAGSAFNAIVDALDATNKFRVVSRPSITTTNNKKAIISSGESIAIPQNINSGFTGSNVGNGGLVTQSSVAYRDVVLQLEVLPLINSEREVTLEVVQKIDQQSGSDTISGNAIPRIATRNLSTTVTVKNEGTLVLGGLIKQTDNRTTSGIPVLSRIPGIGGLFRTTTRDKARTELIVLLRPVVTMGPVEDAANRERTMEALSIEPDVEATIYPPNLRKKDRFAPAPTPIPATTTVTTTSVKQTAPKPRKSAPLRGPKDL